MGFKSSHEQKKTRVLKSEVIVTIYLSQVLPPEWLTVSGVISIGIFVLWWKKKWGNGKQECLFLVTNRFFINGTDIPKVSDALIFITIIIMIIIYYNYYCLIYLTFFLGGDIKMNVWCRAIGDTALDIVSCKEFNGCTWM